MRLCGAQYVGESSECFIDGKLLTAMGNAFIILLFAIKAA